jgi:hypothetical protein
LIHTSNKRGVGGRVHGELLGGKAHSRSLGFAPNEQKIKPIESISIFSVHFTLNLPQASQLLGMNKK